MDNFRGNHKNHGNQTLYNKIDEEEQEDVVANASFFSKISCFNWWRNNYTDSHFLLNRREEEKRESWFEKKLKRVKEASELLAGPKWKNFISKLGGYFCEGNTGKTKRFRYDSKSYALNFDDRVHESNDRLFAGFSARFAPPSNHYHSPSAI